MASIERTRIAILIAILVAGAILRLNGITQGLPGLYDPDEPLFFVNAFELLNKKTLQPGWFGHPGTTTLYLLAAVDIAVFLIGQAGGQWPDAAGFAVTLYNDPSSVVLPARLSIVALATLVIVMTARLGKALEDPTAGVIAALILSVSPLHVELSNLVRTDIMVSLFTLCAMHASVDVIKTGSLKHLVVAGLWMGAAAATKWPGTVLILSPLLSWWWYYRNNSVMLARGFLLIFASVILTMAVLMPPLWLRPLDVWAALLNEMQPAHVGATGGNWFFNLRWYANVLWERGLGISLFFVPLGIFHLITKKQWNFLLVTVIPSTFLVFVLCTQTNVWQRWMILPLPILALMAGVAISTLLKSLRSRKHKYIASVLLIGTVAPMANAAWYDGRERSKPTQARAVEAALKLIPPGSSITVEMLAFPLLQGDWRIRYPFGPVGCVDGRQLLAARVNYDDAAAAQRGKQKLVLGTIDPTKLASCWSDYAIIHDADRWLAERDRYPTEAGVYQAFLDGGRVVGEYNAIPRYSSGPRTIILKLRKTPPQT